jgi:hypothetical protein
MPNEDLKISGMMTAYALARIFSKLFGEVDFAAIDTDRNKYPIGKIILIGYFSFLYCHIGSGRVIFTSIHSYFSAMTVRFFCRKRNISSLFLSGQLCIY